MTDAVRDMPSVRLPVLREWRITEIAPDGSARSVRLATTIDKPQIHVDRDGRWSVGTLGAWTLAGPAPLRRLGRATLDLADAALGVVR